MRFLSPVVRLGLLLFLVVGLVGCGYLHYLIPLNPTASTATTPPTHTAWDVLLKKYVNDQGLVNYKALQPDSLALNAYLSELATHLPSADWTDADRLAYWINAYNAFTVQLIVRHYPVKSIKDLGGDKIFVNTPWDIAFVKLGSKPYSLNDIEHRIIRKHFKDNRIHVALVCAAISCPRLRNEAYTGPRLSAQLDEQGRDFLNNPAKTSSLRRISPRCHPFSIFTPRTSPKTAANRCRSLSTATPIKKSVPTHNFPTSPITGT